MIILTEWAALTALLTCFIILNACILAWFLVSCYFFAFLVTFVVNLYLKWKLKSEDYFHVESLSLAILGGKLFFKKVQYTTKNYALIVEEGWVYFPWWYILNPKWGQSK